MKALYGCVFVSKVAFRYPTRNLGMQHYYLDIQLPISACVVRNVLYLVFLRKNSKKLRKSGQSNVKNEEERTWKK